MKTPPIRILIIEDDPDDQAILMRQLTKADLHTQVKLIADGGLAFAYLNDTEERCETLIAVFLDLKLPTMGGLRLLKAIRASDRLRQLPVIVMSAPLTEADAETCRQLNVASHIPKPVTFTAFVRAVANTFHASLATSPLRIGLRTP